MFRNTYTKGAGNGILHMLFALQALRGLDLQTGFFKLRQIKAAPNNFDPVNKIGHIIGWHYNCRQLFSKSKRENREFVNEVA
ncbi:probable LRR receptor-like serine/threonine-protein kinase At1g53440 [Rosa chinensis]|uniref:probable LRR receptor-like serine/threonine-protein kinase At1g53440 n=1 Tax=Rosa chinensis TaxID=74649 RepID=UPI001AD91D12|nr:probable LRR receptor-like serine/threonine-protein kinase At1g53440 [Rosa chinensis]